jgi:hypothetical protein
MLYLLIVSHSGRELGKGGDIAVMIMILLAIMVLVIAGTVIIVIKDQSKCSGRKKVHMDFNIFEMLKANIDISKEENDNNKICTYQEKEQCDSPKSPVH